MIKTQDALQFLKEQPDYSADMLFCDPPYALGSEITIRQDGKPDYSKAVDFMNKWDMPDGRFWEEFYKEAFRVLKYGGHCLMYGMDRQNFMFKYYGHLAGFIGKQSLYWYFISNFPKASDLSKMIDKNAGAERDVVGKKQHAKKDFRENLYAQDDANKNNERVFGYGEEKITAPSTPLAKKYSGYKYSISPLKQVVEEIMVFQKPMKTGSVLHDVLAMEAGDNTITAGCLDIDGNRVATSEADKNIKAFGSMPESKVGDGGFQRPWMKDKQAILDKQNLAIEKMKELGRYPAQVFLTNTEYALGDAAKILHKCSYEENEFDLFNYCPKVGKSERNAGCEEMEEKTTGHNTAMKCNLCGKWTVGTGHCECSREERQEIHIAQKNNHPTLKPISLNERILKLFKTPNPQRILIPFAGSGSEVIGAIKAGFEDIQGCEINEEYVKIAKARIDYWSKKFKEEKAQTKLC
jgi:site-specific DNA-methyltransferase (adenine-specific)